MAVLRQRRLHKDISYGIKAIWEQFKILLRNMLEETIPKAVPQKKLT